MSLYNHTISPNESSYKDNYLENLSSQQSGRFNNGYEIRIGTLRIDKDINDPTVFVAKYFPVRVSDRLMKLSVSSDGGRVKVSDLDKALKTKNTYTIMLASHYTIVKTLGIWEQIPQSIRTRLIGRGEPAIQPIVKSREDIRALKTVHERKLARREGFPTRMYTGRKTLAPLVTYFRPTLFGSYKEDRGDPRESWFNLLKYLSNDYRYKLSGDYDVIRFPRKDSPPKFDDVSPESRDTALYRTITPVSLYRIFDFIMTALYDSRFVYDENEVSRADGELFGGYTAGWEIIPLSKTRPVEEVSGRGSHRESRFGAAFPRFDVYTDSLLAYSKITGNIAPTSYYTKIRKLHAQLQIFTESKISVDDKDGQLQFCFSHSVYTSLDVKYGESVTKIVTMEKLMYLTSLHATNHGGLNKIDDLGKIIADIGFGLEINVRYHQPGKNDGDRTKSRLITLRSDQWVPGSPSADIYLSVTSCHYIADFDITDLQIYRSALRRLDVKREITSDEVDMSPSVTEGRVAKERPIYTTVEYIKVLEDPDYHHLTREETPLESMCRLTYKAPVGYLGDEIMGYALHRLQTPYDKIDPDDKSKWTGLRYLEQEMVDRRFHQKVLDPNSERTEDSAKVTSEDVIKAKLVISKPEIIARKIWAAKLSDEGLDEHDMPFDQNDYQVEVAEIIDKYQALIKKHGKMELTSLKKWGDNTPIKLVIDCETWTYDENGKIVLPNRTAGEQVGFCICVRSFEDNKVMGRFSGFDCDKQVFEYIDKRYGIHKDENGEYPDRLFTPKQLEKKAYLIANKKWKPANPRKILVFCHNSKFDSGVLLPGAKEAGWVFEDRCLNAGKPVSLKLSKKQDCSRILELDIRDSWRVMGVGAVSKIPETLFKSKGDEKLYEKFSCKEVWNHDIPCEETIDHNTGCLRNDIPIETIKRIVDAYNARDENQADQFDTKTFMEKLEPYTDNGVVRAADYCLYYCERDCDLVCEGLKKQDELLTTINEEIHARLGTKVRKLKMLPSEGYSASGIADRLYAHHGVFRDVYTAAGPLQSFLSAFVSGGRVSLNIQSGQVKKLIDGRLEHYGCADVNSMYPTAQRDLPVGYPRGRLLRPDEGTYQEGTCMSEVVRESGEKHWQAWFAVCRVKRNRVDDFLAKLRPNLSFGLYPNRLSDGSQLAHESEVISWINDVTKLERLYMSSIRFEEFCRVGGVDSDMFELVGDRQFLYYDNFYKLKNPRVAVRKEGWSDSKYQWVCGFFAAKNKARQDELDRERESYVPPLRAVTETLYQVRMTARAEGSKGKDKLAKLYMCGSYGRLLMSIDGTSNTLVHGRVGAWLKLSSAPSKYTSMVCITFESDPESRTYSLETHKRWTDTAPNRVACGALVLDQARSMFGNLLHCAAVTNNRLEYMDTDSATLSIRAQNEINAKHQELYGKPLIGEGLGYFSTDLELTYKDDNGKEVTAKDGVVAIELCILGRKSYCYRLLDTKSGRTGYKTALKGVGTKAINLECHRKGIDRFELFKQLYYGDKLIFDNAAGGGVRFVSKGSGNNPNIGVYKYLSSMTRAAIFN